MKKLWKRSAVLLVLFILCTMPPAVSAAQEPDKVPLQETEGQSQTAETGKTPDSSQINNNEKTAAEPSGRTEDTPPPLIQPEETEETQGLETDNPLGRMLLDIHMDFTEKIGILSKEENLFKSLRDIGSREIIQAYFGSLDVKECYQYVIYLQHELLILLNTNIESEDVSQEDFGKLIKFALEQLKENSIFLRQKSEAAPLEKDAGQSLEDELFQAAYAEKYKDVKVVTSDEEDAEEKVVSNLAELRTYLAVKSTIDIEGIYHEMRCYRGESDSEDIETEQAAFERHMVSFYNEEGESDSLGVQEGEDVQDNPKEEPWEELSDQEMEKEPSGQDMEKVKKAEEQAEPESTEEPGEGVLEKAASRSVDLPPDPAEYMKRTRMFSLSEPKEEKYYEIYAKTAEGTAESMEVAVSVEDTKETYEAEEGEYELDGAKYNWRLRVPYSEMPLEGSDGSIQADITVKNAQKKVVGRANTLASRASGVYSDKKAWVGSDFSKLNTNKNATQVYYVYGTVYSDDYNNHYISKNSIFGANTYSTLSISSYDNEKATIRLRTSGYANKGTWVAIYGRMTLSNLNIISTGNSGDLGIVSAKNPDPVNASTRQSVMTVTNCSFSNGGKWAIHGDRNSYLDVSGCTISNTKGGVGSHGEINVRNCSLNNSGSSYTGRAGVHLNVPISQGSFKHSMNLQNNVINGYAIGVEYAVSNLFASQPVGNTIQSLSITTTGSGNTISNCTTGLRTTKQNVTTPYTVDVQHSMQDITGCAVGIQNNDNRDTFKISGGNIHSGNKGVENAGTFVMSGGNIYSNAIGIENAGAASMSSGTIHDNYNSRNGSGITNSGTFSISGGYIYNNAAANGGAIFNQPNGTLNISGGEIYSNTGTAAGGGIYNNHTLNVTGGEIYSNSSPQGAGIYQNGTLNIGGAAHFNTNNEVYLASGKFVTVTHALTFTTVGLLTPSDYTLGRLCIRAAYNGTKGSAVFLKFMLKENAPYLLRPGDYQSGSGAAAADVVISRGYAVAFNKNYSDEVTNVPEKQTKYWYEAVRLPAQIPVMEHIKFKGWSEDAGAKNGEYQPGNSIHASVNRDITLYAIWEKKIKVTYVGDYAESGTAKSEYVTWEDCKKNNGYEVKKNAGYTNYTRKEYSFAGWSADRKNSSVRDVKYPENRTNRVTFEALMSIADSQKGMVKPGGDVPEVFMLDVWDRAPRLMADGVQEFFEGTEVTKDMLLKNVKAEDEEDGDITGDIRIIGIEYADGKLVNGEKSKGVKEKWEDDMPDDYKLDTWFQQLDKEDSPVTHKIIYAVSDSGGNITVLEWNIKVNYNEFPKIETVDRYFTLEEAKQGAITEEILINASLSDGKLKVTDKEDDELYPGTIAAKIELKDFCPEEFTSFEESGYIVLTYSVKDSMGPDGEGKETFRQFTVHVVKDGEIIEPEPEKYVRFINQEHYEKNAEAAQSELTDDEKERISQNGGLHVDSKWYCDEAYKNAIASLWSDSAPEETWRFEKGDVQKVKDYIDAHGIGNSKEADALAGFVAEFAYLRSF